MVKDALNSELRYLQNEMGIIMDVNTDELLGLALSRAKAQLFLCWKLVPYRLIGTA
jgi:hypothetical protein